jgi:hypothetical protein
LSEHNFGDAESTIFSANHYRALTLEI